MIGFGRDVLRAVVERSRLMLLAMRDVLDSDETTAMVERMDRTS